MGTADFAVPSLNALIEAGMTPVAVVTVPDAPAGRGLQVRESPVKESAVGHGIPVLQPDDLQSANFIEEIRNLDPDVIAVVAFRILPPEVYTLAKRGAFNLHASLLPRFRGAAPINRAIMDGASETGVTTFFLKAAVDTGAIIKQAKTRIGREETAGELHDRLAELGAPVVVETVRLIASGEATGSAQDDSKASSAPKLFRKDCQIDWSQSAAELHDFVRGLSPYPAAWTTWQDETIKIYRARVFGNAAGVGEPGEVLLASHSRLVVATGSGALELLELQREGRKRMSAGDFLNGTPIDVGQRLS